MSQQSTHRILTPEERHTSRTQQQINEIKQRWQQRINKLEIQSKLTEITITATKAGVTYNNVTRLAQALKEDEIISKIGGGDKTKGSCSSLAFTYAANKAGLDVRDFRGGKSCETFSSSSIIMSIAKKVGGQVSKNGNDFTNAKNLLASAQEGHEIISHAERMLQSYAKHRQELLNIWNYNPPQATVGNPLHHQFLKLDLAQKNLILYQG